MESPGRSRTRAIEHLEPDLEPMEHELEHLEPELESLEPEAGTSRASVEKQASC